MSGLNFFHSSPVGYVLCKCDTSLVLLGKLKTPSQISEFVRVVKAILPCGICNENVSQARSWAHHYIEKHLPVEDVNIFDIGSVQALSIIMQVKPEKCIICNIQLGDDQTDVDHLKLHLTRHEEFHLYYLNDFMTVLTKEFNQMTQVEQREIYSVTNLFMLYHTRSISLYVYVPTWIPGETLKEQLLNVTTPTTIYLSMDNRLPPLQPDSFDLYKMLLYLPMLDVNYEGYRTWLAKYIRYWIIIHASIAMSMNPFPHLQFMFVCDTGHAKMKLLLEMVDEDAVIDDVTRILRSKCGLLCPNDLQAGMRCIDDGCQHLLHVTQNVDLVRRRRNRRTTAICPPQRLRNASLGIGCFNFCRTDGEETIETFVTHFKHAIRTPPMFFVYVAMLERREDSIVDNLEKKKLIYFGFSTQPMIPNQHLKIIQIDYAGANDDSQDNDNLDVDVNEGLFGENCNELGLDERMEVDDEQAVNNTDQQDAGMLEGNEENEEGGGALPEKYVSGTSLGKKYCTGHYRLYVIKQYKLFTAKDAFLLEAALQFYGKLMNALSPNEEYEYVNERLEKSKLAFLDRTQIDIIMKLVIDKVRYFWNNRHDYNEQECNHVNWGIFEGPVFAEDKFECIPFIP